MRSAPPLRLGIVGAGFNARFHVRSLVAVRDVVVAGVQSRTRASAEALASLADELGVGEARVHGSAEALAADAEVDAVWINGPNDARVETMEAIVRGNAARERPLRGIACEKPLARTLGEAERMVALARESGVPTGYLENMVFVPALRRGKEILWRRGAALAGRPHLARAAEEHAGPHAPWFWIGTRAGGGALIDMMSHGLETARWLLTEPGAPRASLTPVEATARTECLKWGRPEHAERLRRSTGGAADYVERPSEDWASASVVFVDAAGRRLVAESTTSWGFVGAGLRHGIELLGPEYSMRLDTLETGLSVFFSRRVAGEAGEDLVEKQNAEQGLMPVVADEPSHYGYVAENRHFVRAFRSGEPPELGFADGLEVMRLVAACYRSAEERRAVDPRDPALSAFEPAVCRGTWTP